MSAGHAGGAAPTAARSPSGGRRPTATRLRGGCSILPSARACSARLGPAHALALSLTSLEASPKVLLSRCGYDTVELNASDTRSEKALKAMAADLVTNSSIKDYADGRLVSSKMALVMDEVDGMSAGDRGGVAALLAVIRRSKMPVVCICNDRQSPKIKSLANHCLDLRFRRPSPLEVTSALKRVVALEGYAVDEATLDKIAQACNADIRQMLNLLQIWRPKEGSPALSQAQVSANLRSSFKDISVGPFDVADRFFNAVHTSSVI